MTWNDPEGVIAEAERRKAAIADHYLPAVEWFLDGSGLRERGDVVEDLAGHLDVDRETASIVVGHLVSDDADPVQQVVQPPGERYVGVIDHAEHDWFYAFDRYDDVGGRQRRAVCAHCVHEVDRAADATHVTRSPDEYDRDAAALALAIHYHVDHEGRALRDVIADLGVDPAAFAERHDIAGPDAIALRDVTRRLDEDPDLAAALDGAEPPLDVPEVDVEPGASLVSGTTIAGNVAWHAGNDGAGSGLNADRLDGMELTEITGGTRTVTFRETYTYGYAAYISTTVPVTATSAKLQAYQNYTASFPAQFTAWITPASTLFSRTATVTNTLTTGETLTQVWFSVYYTTVLGGTLYFYY